MITGLWRWFWAPTARFGWGAIFLAGGLAGVILWGGFNTYVEYTNTLGFCISCHEMEETVFREYKRSSHYANASGVRVICADCHVPKDWTAKILRKVKATNELYHKIAGSVGTPKKFEAKRLQMAENVWASIGASDSRECRNCHSFEAMDFDKQPRRPREKHPTAMEKGETCIDCHKGVAHKLPEDYEDDD